MKQYTKAILALLFLVLGSLNVSGSAGEKSGRRLLKVMYIDVGQGDSEFIETPGGKTILIDAGKGPTGWSSFNAGKSIVVPLLKKLKVKKIDFVLMSHAHNDHIGGLSDVLNNFEVGTFIDPGFQYPSYVYENLLDIIDKKKIKYEVKRAGSIIKLDKYCHFQVFNPPAKKYFRGGSEPNDNSLALKLTYGKISFLFMGDVEKKAEAHIVHLFRKDLACTVLKVAHHGSKTSSTEQFMDWAQPMMAVIEVGEGNRFGHPKREILKRLKEYGCKTYRTDRDGTVLVATDGKKYKVSLIDTGIINPEDNSRTVEK